MNKSLLVFAGIALLAVPSVQAQGRGRAGGAAPSSASVGRGGSVGRSSAGVYRGGSRFGGYRGYGYRGNRGRYYYLGGVPYFYPFFDSGFGYPFYGAGFYGSGFYGGGFGGYGGYGAYDGYGPGAYGAAPYDARIVDEGGNRSNQSNDRSLPTAVQRQLAERGYYKGGIDGEFGEGSRSALRRFQREHRLKDTGRIDEATLQALGFADHR